MINWHTLWSGFWLSSPQHRLREPLWDKQEFPPTEPLSARQAWERVQCRIREFDPEVSLRSIEAVQGVLPDGRALGWVFGVDAPNRRAQGQIHWQSLPEQGVSFIQRNLHPFPAIGSPQHRLAASGAMPDRWLEACWTAMRERAADIPEDFVDSSNVLAFLASRGVPVDNVDHLSLAAPQAGPAQSEWELRVGAHSFRLPAKQADLPA